MSEMMWQTERNRMCAERHELSVERLNQIMIEEGITKPYVAYFQEMAAFLLELEAVRLKISDGSWDNLELQEMKELNALLYSDVLPAKYEKSYANPAFAVQELGETFGQLLSMLYAELRSGIAYAFENRKDYLTILNELLIEVYTCFEEKVPEFKTVKEIIYWYASDYCDVFLADRIEEQLIPELSIATEWIMEADLDDERYLYRFGEYITENEIGTARHLATLSDEVLQKMADVYTEGYRIGFINTGKDLSKKAVVDLRYCLGFERVVKIAIENFRKMGLEPAIYRAASSVITRKEQFKIGYYGAIANPQYDYDHRSDQALFMDKRYVERKLDILKNTYEKNKEQAALMGGPAVMEIFGEKPFSPDSKQENLTYDEAQRELTLLYTSKSGQLTNQYIKGEERSFTIVAYPIPEIGEQYKEIFDEVIKINTLDANLYEKVQQTMIDALDQGEAVRILGKGENKTDLTVQLYKLNDPEKETIFENCVADVNIPVGEVFTSPVLEGTNGTLHVSRVFLEGLQYCNLEIQFKDGMIESYTCSNFEDEEENKKYIYDNILHNHPTLPIGEFAIGTNTTAYVMANQYDIVYKLPILIVEKMGPHFAIGDTCYSRAEDNIVYNPNGKEIISRDNEISILRKTEPEKAYFNCHTDITIPYDEIGSISAVSEDGSETVIIENGRFVLAGCEELNKPFLK